MVEWLSTAEKHRHYTLTLAPLGVPLWFSCSVCLCVSNSLCLGCLFSFRLSLSSPSLSPVFLFLSSSFSHPLSLFNRPVSNYLSPVFSLSYLSAFVCFHVSILNLSSVPCLNPCLYPSCLIPLSLLTSYPRTFLLSAFPPSPTIQLKHDKPGNCP